ncbi:MAG: exopolysaccharide biosynthesis polyprenyl glycosylphosphotransferase, partial [Bacteroidales bacterium]|nr:exopolysaccharide biosynthesis polyprenyl glycosylphosphotransferase [Bacteroidales bacterium]
MKRNAIFVGAGVNLRAIYNRLAKDLTTGYVIQGYFEDHVSEHLGEELPRLGDVSDVVNYLNENKGKVDLVFCNQPDSMAESVREIVRCCENNLIHFYTVPNVNNFLNRRMTVQYVDDMPVFTMRDEPLRLPHNRAIKRLFDIIASLLFLVLIFWWVYIIVAIITKITMPGPVFFKQKRSGDHRKEFTCLKFRSMKVNDQADLVQATKNDPRKTKWGNFLRKTSIDEFPQFINVLRNDMSIVGPRPHMLKHTEEYSKIIDKYMVRHYAKPGITGWAQVKGFRGETPETWMMEERIKKDIWYIEHWTFMLDIKIIFMTIFNWMGKEKGNAY